MAYEVKNGPFGPLWDRQMLADVQYLLQWNNYLLGAQLTPEGKKNKVPEPVLPHGEWLGNTEEDEDDEEE